MPDGTILGDIDVDTTNDDIVELANIGESTVRIDYMYVDEEAQGFGLATQMIQALADECRLQGIRNIDGYFISPAAIGAMVNAFGEERIQFYHDLTTPIPLTVGQAYETASEERIDELLQIAGPSVDPDDIATGVYIRVRL